MSATGQEATVDEIDQGIYKLLLELNVEQQMDFEGEIN